MGTFMNKMRIGQNHPNSSGSNAGLDDPNRTHKRRERRSFLKKIIEQFKNDQDNKYIEFATGMPYKKYWK